MEPTCLQLLNSWLMIKQFLSQGGYVHYAIAKKHLELFEEKEREDAKLRLRKYLEKRGCNFKPRELTKLEKNTLMKEYQVARLMVAESIRRAS